MVLIPKVLGMISKPLEITYKAARLVFRLKGTRQALGVADQLLGFTLDLTGKAKLSLTLLILKFLHGSLQNQHLAIQTSNWLAEQRRKLADEAAPPTTQTPGTAETTGAGKGAAPVPRAAPTSAAPSPSRTPDNSVEELRKDLKEIFSREDLLACASPAARAGLVFLSDCLAQEAQTCNADADPVDPTEARMDRDVASRFLHGGKLDTRAALTAFYSTPTAPKLVAALSTPAGMRAADTLMPKVYSDLRLALRRGLMDMFVY